LLDSIDIHPRLVTSAFPPCPTASDGDRERLRGQYPFQYFAEPRHALARPRPAGSHLSGYSMSKLRLGGGQTCRPDSLPQHSHQKGWPGPHAQLFRATLLGNIGNNRSPPRQLILRPASMCLVSYPKLYLKLMKWACFINWGRRKGRSTASINHRNAIGFAGYDWELSPLPVLECPYPPDSSGQ